MVSGLAPGKLAATVMVGKSIWGSGDTGRTVNATAPASAIAAVSKTVATGRWMNGGERLMSRRFCPPPLPSEWAREFFSQDHDVCSFFCRGPDPGARVLFAMDM